MTYITRLVVDRKDGGCMSGTSQIKPETRAESRRAKRKMWPSAKKKKPHPIRKKHPPRNKQ